MLEFIKNNIMRKYIVFLSFLLILPILGFKEKTLPVPLSITEPVMGGSPNLATARNQERLNIK